MKSSTFTLIVAVLAIIAGAGWIALCGLVFWIQADAPAPLIEFDLFLKIVIGVSPLLHIWVLAFLFQTSFVRGQELELARQEMTELRKTSVSLSKKLRLLEDTLIEETARPPPGGKRRSTAEELAFRGRPLTAPPKRQDQLLEDDEKSMFSVPPSIIIRALNFPESDDDTAGFDALNDAVKEPAIGKLLEDAQKVLEALAEEGIYMETVTPEYARTELWRMHASGAVRQEISTLGSIDDKSLIRHVTEWTKSDGPLLSLSQAMVDQFHIVLHEFARIAEDDELYDLINTRTAKAYILLGSVLSDEY